MSDMSDETSEVDLYAEIGRQLAGKQAFALNHADLVERGQRWFAAQTDRLRDLICGGAFEEVVSNDSDRKKALLAISDLLAKYYFDIAPMTIAALILKITVRAFCKR